MTAAEILAALAADPALAVEVAAGLPGLRIAGPWQQGDGGEGARRRSVSGRWAAEVIRYQWELHRPWKWFAGEQRDAATIREEALAAADAALVADGWRLA